MAAPPVTILDDVGLSALADEQTQHIHSETSSRRLVGIAGIPGAGKSTLASRLCDRITHHLGPVAVTVPMDGFHLTNLRLAARGLLGRKGSPETFDAVSFVALLRQIRDPSCCCRFPIYDRNTHEPRLTDDPQHRISTTTRLVIVEGNYLLLPDSAWDELAEILDETWLLDTPPEQAGEWIVARHRAVGRTAEQARQKYANDQRNARCILERMRPPDRILRWP